MANPFPKLLRSANVFVTWLQIRSAAEIQGLRSDVDRRGRLAALVRSPFA